MINFKKLLKRDRSLVAIGRDEIEMLTYILSHKRDFESWFSTKQKNHTKIRFVFYYPSAVDLFYDEFKLFTVYFKKTNNDEIVFDQFKKSRVNLESLKTGNWKPFKDAILDYLEMAQDRNSDLQMKKFKSLHDYQQLCNGETKSKEESLPFYSLNITNTQQIKTS